MTKIEKRERDIPERIPKNNAEVFPRIKSKEEIMIKFRNTEIILSTVFCLALFGGCTFPVNEEELEEFNQKWESWKARGLVNYSIKTERSCNSCGPGGPHIVVVNEKTMRDSDIHLCDVRTISGLYTLISKEYQNKETKVKIIYNKEFHYPEYVESTNVGFFVSGTTKLSLTEFIPLSEEMEDKD